MLQIAVVSLLTSSVYAANIATAWFASWHADSTPSFPLSSVSWSKYTQMTYAFAETAPGTGADALTLTVNGDSTDDQLLVSFVQAAHDNGVKASVSIGGWTGSRWWSSAVGSAENRTAFVKTVSDFATKYQLDGIDFDWEYPGTQGIGCNVVSTGDVSNFLSFIQELRQDSIGANLILSAAVGTTPYASDMSGFNDALDFIAIMNYDLFGPWSATVGPNAALNDTCAPANDQVASAVSAVQAWSGAGFSRDKIVLGVAAYGHSFSVSKANAFESGTQTLALFPPFESSQHPAGDAWDDPAGVDECGNAQSQGGVINFWGLIAQGYLDASGNPVPGVPFRFDQCSQTPFTYNTTTQVMISFDNAQSFAAKGDFIKSQNLAGFSIWEAGGDSNDILLDAIRSTVFEN